MQMKKMKSGLLEVHAWPTRTLEEQLNSLEEGAPNYDYIVGWLDTITIGHGQIHAANYVHDDPDPAKMQVSYQTLPDRMFGVMPKSLLHYFMTPFMNNFGAWGINTAKYIASLRKHVFRQSARRLPFFAGLCAVVGTFLRTHRTDPVPVVPAEGNRASNLDRDACYR